TSQVSDQVSHEIERAKVKIRLPQVAKIVGLEIPEDDILMILEALDMEVVDRKVDTIEVLVPTNKADVVREADVIEEILRIYGFKHTPNDSKLETALNSGPRQQQFVYRNKISTLLAGMGFDETMGLSFTLPQYLVSGDKPTFVRINNTSNKDLEIMRP